MPPVLGPGDACLGYTEEEEEEPHACGRGKYFMKCLLNKSLQIKPFNKQKSAKQTI